MKKLKSRTKPLEPAAKKPTEVIANDPQDAFLPSTEQLAMIAATLARNADDEPEDLTRRAMILWLDAREQIEIARNFGKPKPEVVLLTRDQFLGEMLPQYKNRTADLARIGKAFMRDNLHLKNKKEPTLDEVAAAFHNWNPCGYEDMETASVWMNENALIIWQRLLEPGRFQRHPGMRLTFSKYWFMGWYAEYVTTTRRAAGQKSAAAKKMKKKL